MPNRAAIEGRYPPDWQAIADRIKFGRAGGRCECTGECGDEHNLGADGRCYRRHGEEYLAKRGNLTVIAVVILTTAHLSPPVANCDDDNLKAMCQACHLKFDWELHARTRQRNKDRAAGQLYLNPELAP